MFTASAHALQSRDSEVLQELSAASLQVVQRAETFLAAGDSGLLVLWQNSQLRQLLTNSLPQLLLLLQHASLVGQQELRSEYPQVVSGESVCM